MFINNYNSRKRIIETNFRASKIHHLDLLMTVIHTFMGDFEAILFYKNKKELEGLLKLEGFACPKCPYQT